MMTTPGDVDARFRKMILSRSPAARLGMSCRMFSTARSLMAAGILAGRGDVDPGYLRERIFLRLYGDDFSIPERERILRYLRTT
jgi:hypothetical protein